MEAWALGGAEGTVAPAPLPLTPLLFQAAVSQRGGARGVRILSIDGGGTRGLVALQLLRGLEKSLNLEGRPLASAFDLICGTSTGSIIAYLLGTVGFSVDVVEALYLELSRRAFTKKGLRVGVGTPSYSAAAFAELLQEQLGGLRMLDAALLTRRAQEGDGGGGPHVFCVSACVSTTPPLPYLFRTYTHAPGRPSRYPGFAGARAWEALRASTAAPGYFDPVTLGRGEGRLTLVDGAVLHNNPTSLALHEAGCLWPSRPIDAIISVGTGRPPVSAEAGAYFLLKTYSALVSSATDTERTHQVLEDVFPPSVYIRLNPEHEACATELDDVNPETADTLKRVAVDYLEANQPLIQRAAAALRGTNTPPTPATPAAALRPTGGGARASSPGCQRSASCSAPELPGDLPPPRETHPQPMHRRARSAGLTHGDSPPRSSGARGFRRSRWSGTDADEELASAADGAAELDDDSSPADSPSSAGESIARAHGGLRRRTSIEARPTAEAVLSAAVRRLVNEHLVSYLRAKPVGALARLVDAAASTMARSHGDFIRVQTFLSWLLRPFAEPETHHAGDLWVVVQPLAVIGGHEKVFIAFLTSAGLPSEVRKHGGRPWLAVHALALLPSALHCAAPSAAQAQARKRDQIEESMRWLAGVISALKDKASRVMLASGAVAGSPGGARAVPTRGADGDEALAPPPAARHEGGSHGQQLVRRVELEALDAKVERILRLIEAQAAATSGGR